jgi:hypothetical protein
MLKNRPHHLSAGSTNAAHDFIDFLLLRILRKIAFHHHSHERRMLECDVMVPESRA